MRPFSDIAVIVAFLVIFVLLSRSLYIYLVKNKKFYLLGVLFLFLMTLFFLFSPFVYGHVKNEYRIWQFSMYIDSLIENELPDIDVFVSESKIEHASFSNDDTCRFTVLRIYAGLNSDQLSKIEQRLEAHLGLSDPSAPLGRAAEKSVAVAGKLSMVVVWVNVNGFLDLRCM